jgi:hypothetical protein
MLHVVVDGANVVGSRPDGWWRDRAGAARRLTGQLVAALAADPSAVAELTTHRSASGAAAEVTVHLVLEGAAARVDDLPVHPRLAVVRAPADGDSAIAALVDELVGTAADGGVLVVTADRALRERVRSAGADTTGPGSLLRALGSGAEVVDGAEVTQEQRGGHFADGAVRGEEPGVVQHRRADGHAQEHHRDR